MHGGDLHYWQNHFKMLGKRYGPGLLFEAVILWRKTKEKAGFLVFNCKDPFASRDEYLHVVSGLVRGVKRGFKRHFQRGPESAGELNDYMMACARRKPLAEAWLQLYKHLMVIFIAMDCANEPNERAHPLARCRAGNSDLHLWCQIEMLRLCACTNSHKYVAMSIYHWLSMLRASPVFADVFRNLVFTGDTEKDCQTVRDMVMERVIKCATRHMPDAYTLLGEAKMRSSLLNLHKTAEAEAKGSLQATGIHPRTSASERDLRHERARRLPESKEANIVADFMDTSKMWDLSCPHVCVVDPIARQRAQLEAHAAARSKAATQGGDEDMVEATGPDEQEQAVDGFVEVNDKAYVLNDGTASAQAWLAQLHSPDTTAALLAAVQRAMADNFRSPGGVFAEQPRREDCCGVADLRKWHLQYSQDEAFMLTETVAGNPALFATAEAATGKGQATLAKRRAAAKANAKDRPGGRSGTAKLFSLPVVKGLLQELKPMLFELVAER